MTVFQEMRKRAPRLSILGHYQTLLYWYYALNQAAAGDNLTLTLSSPCGGTLSLFEYFPVDETGFCWFLARRGSNSPLVSLFALLENCLGLWRVVLFDPWVLFIAQKKSQEGLTPISGYPDTTGLLQPSRQMSA